ncbi:addiction module protein [Indioceanicola profundi]|uniref:addiction module protein n=1 Tax=Indioceanicola profundi TaxID=2220096 RepID=UPI000E6AB0EC|nr:addiction module protein [Indioceanicola profundi]
MPVLDFSHLTPQQRLQLIGELWESLEKDRLSLTDAQAAELEHRMELAESGQTDWFTWDELEADLERRTR